MPRKSRMKSKTEATEQWVKNRGRLAPGMRIKVHSNGQVLTVISVNDCGALVQEGEGRTRIFTDSKTGKEVELKGKGKRYQISATSEVLVLRKVKKVTGVMKSRKRAER